MEKDSLIDISKNEIELGKEAAKLFLEQAQRALSRGNSFSVALSGGKTPRFLYQTLATLGLSKQLPWERFHFFWGDERNVPSDHPQSNFRMAWEAMLSMASVPSENIHRVRTELESPEAIALDYEKQIRDFFGLARPEMKPHFDLILLGIGEDGHTLSLFPDGKPGVEISRQDPNRLVIAPWVPHLNEYRISVTPLVANEALEVLFLVSGAQKAAILKKILNPDEQSTLIPARAIRPAHGKLTWLVDEEAAREIAPDHIIRRRNEAGPDVAPPRH